MGLSSEVDSYLIHLTTLDSTTGGVAPMENRCFPLHFSVSSFTPAINTSGGRIPH